MRRNPTYDFRNRNEIGIYQVPLKSMVYIIDSNEHGKPRIVQIISKNGIRPDTTIGQFLADQSLYTDIQEANEVYSELEKITEAGNTGWRLLGKNIDNYGYIGEDAVDFSISNLSSNWGLLESNLLLLVQIQLHLDTLRMLKENLIPLLEIIHMLVVIKPPLLDWLLIP